MKDTLLAFKDGLYTGFLIQLAIGPIFLYIINLSFQKTLLDGFMGVLAATAVSYIYIALSAFGIGRMLEKEKIKKIFGTVSSIVLIIFGGIIIIGAINTNDIKVVVNTANPLASFTSVFLLAISNPLSVVFFTGLFSVKAIEYNYTKNELYFFGLGTGLSTMIFMGGAVLMFSFLRGMMPLIVMQALNILVGSLIIGYGVIRLLKLMNEDRLKSKSQY